MTTQGFFDDGYEDAVRGNRLPDGKYHLVVVENLGEPEFSTPDRPCIQLGVEVASGEYEGRGAPRVNLQLGAWEYTNPKNGKTRITTAEEMATNLKADVRAIHGLPPPQIPAGVAGLELLDVIADQLVGDEFFATVKTKGDFQNLGYYRNIDDPPKGMVLAADTEEFKV